MYSSSCMGVTITGGRGYTSEGGVDVLYAYIMYRNGCECRTKSRCQGIRSVGQTGYSSQLTSYTLRWAMMAEIKSVSEWQSFSSPSRRVKEIINHLNVCANVKLTPGTSTYVECGDFLVDFVSVGISLFVRIDWPTTTPLSCP